ncbi:hypothetical protein EDC19_2782 [Natranaerovirga hydrolytica]|uniref:Transcriptional regulator n=1 Tax=Natranaerovirga hydrolytica TaxID=680378 RepID=A0A4R1M3P8_9FIRM|nr:transcription repressor NadR [Natranaerovirga hydrolytica]TCK86728.1 hypothetical protein EDC19_2782 [Natranaerovirga hydrolytica]
MEAVKRRKKIIELLKLSKDAISGTELANKLGVTRQVIVQDIALIRAKEEEINILSTSRGYLLYKERHEKPKKVFAVKHDHENITEELYTIVDLGGTVLNVIVEHPIYGDITVSLILKSRKDVDDFIKDLSTKKTQPLMHLTDGEHFHTVEAEEETILSAIEEALGKKGYLIKP